MKKLAIAAIISSLLSTSSFADNQIGKFYFEAGGGVAKLENPVHSLIKNLSNMALIGGESNEIPFLNPGKNGIIEGEIGYQISLKMRLGLALRHYFESNSYYSNDEKRLDERDFTVTKEGDLISKQTISGGFLNAYYDLYQSDKINIFVHSGIGLNYTKISFQGYDTRLDKLKDEYIVKQWGFGLKGGFGVGYAVTSNIVAQVKYEYNSLGEFLVKGTTQAGDDGEKVKMRDAFSLGGHAVIVGVRINL